jgi:predicted RNase H-like HicB family nuclease
MAVSENLRMTIVYEEPDEDGWIVARVVEVPGAISQGRTKEEARETVIDALRLMLSPDEASRSTPHRLGEAPRARASLERRGARSDAAGN